MINRILLLTFVLIIVMGLASSYDDLGFTRINNPYNITLGCSYNNTFCPNTFNCNLTVYSPNAVIVNNQPMSTAFYPQFNYTVPANNISIIGLYYGRQVCCNTAVGCSNEYSFQFYANPQGKDNSNDGLVYIIMFSLLILLFVFSVFSFIRIPFNNPRNGDGHVINVDWKKYLKIGSFVLAYISLVGIVYFAWNLSYGILQFDEMANFFQAMFRILFVGMFLVLPVSFVYGVIIFIYDKITYDKLIRGLTVK